jgi:type VI secretion system protein ImpL
MARLNAKVFARVEEDRDVRRRAKIFAFPQQMAALRDVLSQFIGEVFASTRMDQQILLRGVYLTSGTQEGTPIDRLLGAIGRRYGVAADAVAPPTGRGKAYFVERLLKEVMLGESGIAGVNRRLEVQKAALQLGAYAAMALIAVLGLLAFSVSYSRNRSYIADTAAALATLEKFPPTAMAASPEALLPRLNAIRNVVTVADRYRDDTPWSMRWGLYQGSSLGNAARDAYVRELDGTLLPRVAARIEERLVEFAPQPEKLYEYLKAYLMLGEPKFMKKDHLQFVANLEWKAADNADPDTAAALSQHFQSLLDYGDTLRPIAMNPTLVAQARNTIKQASIPSLIYSRLKREYHEDGAKAVRLDLAAGVGAESALRRKSGVSLSEPIPSFFSRAGFGDVTTKMVPELVKGFAEDDWVWGDGGAAARSLKMGQQVVDQYERDYIETWDGVLNDLDLAPFNTAAQAADVLAALAAPATSPLRGVLAAISDNTQLVQQTPPPAQPSGAAAAAKKAITDRLGGQAVADKLGGLFGDAAATTRPPGMLVTAHFQPIHRLMAGDPGSAPIDAIILRIGQVEHQLRTMGGAGGGSLGTLSDPELKEILRSLQQESAILPPVVQSLVGQIGRRAEGSVVAGAATELTQQYQQEVQSECSQVLSGRYPFTPGSTADLPLTDFANLFQYGGVFDRFFQEKLAPFVDRSRSPWTWNSGSVQGPQRILDTFEKAQKIRELFFRRGTNAMEVRFHLTVAETDTNAIRFLLDIDGNIFEYKNPPQNTLAQWPGPGQNIGNASVTWVERYGAQPRVAFTGPWAWFRLINAAQVEQQDVRSTLTFQQGGHRARVILEAGSIINPFSNRDWQRFSCQ